MGVDYTGGWDVVAATSFANITKLLTYAYQQNVTPHSGNGSFPVPLGPVTITATVNAQVGAWSMTGGSGQNVVIQVPFTGGSATIGTKTYQLAGVGLSVTVLLRFVRSTVSGGSDYQLMLVVTDPSAIVAATLTSPPPNMTPDEQSALQITLTNLLKSSLGGQGVALANLNLAQVAQQYPWLIPNNGIDYAAGSNSASPGDGQLGLLLATVSAPPGTPPTLVAGVIPQGCSGALIVSNKIFTQQFLAPAFASSLNVGTNQLTYMSSNPMIAALVGNASAGGGTITSAQAYANNNIVSLQMSGNASPMSGVSVNFTINATYGLTLSGPPNAPVLSFSRISQNENHSTDIAWWVWLIAGITGGVIGAAVVAIIQQVVNSAAGSSLGGALPSGFAQQIAWPFGGTVNITQANLPLPLQLGGTLTS